MTLTKLKQHPWVYVVFITDAHDANQLTVCFVKRAGSLQPGFNLIWQSSTVLPLPILMS